MLLVHAPGDDWVDSDEATRFATAPAGVGSHNEVLGETALADCIIEFVRERHAPVPQPDLE